MSDRIQEFNSEEFQEYGRKLSAYFAQCDQVIAAEHERLLPLLLDFLGVPRGDYKAGLIRLAERCVPAFKKAEKRGPVPVFNGELRFLAPVENIKPEKNLIDTAALQILQPDPKTAQSPDNLQI